MKALFRSRPVLIGAFLILATGACRAQQGDPALPAQAHPGTPEGGWPEWRGEPQNRGVSHSALPTLKDVKWRFIADTDIRCSPAVAGDSVYFASKGGRVFRVRAQDGIRVWDRLHAGPGDDKDAAYGFTYSSPLVRDGRVYLGSEDGFLYCLDAATGDLVWRSKLPAVGSDTRVWSSPKTDGSLVFAGSNGGFITALDRATGAIRWKTWIGEEIGGAAGIIGGDLVIAAKDRRVHVLNKDTGEVQWGVPTTGWSMGTPVLELGCAFVRATGGRIACVDFVTRGAAWIVEVPPASNYAQTSAAHDGERLYVTHATGLVALLPDGTIAWRADARASYDASPVVVAGHVCAVSSDGVIRLVDAATGRVVTEKALPDRVVGTPAIVGGVAYVPALSGTLYAVE